ncbi:MAG: hypothetical protein AVDCRST_MAG77-1243, partial [uncultured Chloroflexi bacterium]
GRRGCGTVDGGAGAGGGAAGTGVWLRQEHGAECQAAGGGAGPAGGAAAGFGERAGATAGPGAILA